MAMTTKRRRGGLRLTKTQKRIIAGTAAVAATVGGLYALYRKRKSLKATMKPRVQKLTPEQRETFVKESHKRKLPGKTADEVVERADEAVREARRAAATRRRRQVKRGRTRKRAKRKRSSSGIGYVGGAVGVIVLGVLAAYAVARGGDTISQSNPSPSPSLPCPPSPRSPPPSSSSSSPDDIFEKYVNKMSKRKEWGDQIIIQAALKYYRKSIWIFKERGGEPSIHSDENSRDRNALKIAHVDYESHYQAVVPNDTPGSIRSSNKQFQDLLDVNNLRLLDCGGGGDCLFRCISYFVEGHKKWHYKVRQELVNYISTHKQEFIDDIKMQESYQ